MQAIRSRVKAGVPYVGWSAGSNVACPAISTTNDMPIVEPASFRAVGAVKFQINPHYLDANPEGHAGETREVRLLEFIAAKAACCASRRAGWSCWATARCGFSRRASLLSRYSPVTISRSYYNKV